MLFQRAHGAWHGIQSIRDTPRPFFPCHGTGRITIRLLTHYFDNDAPIPTSNFTLEYRIVAYRETGSSSLSRDFNTFAAVDYTDANIKRCGDVFYVGREFTYGSSLRLHWLCIIIIIIIIIQNILQR